MYQERGEKKFVFIFFKLEPFSWSDKKKEKKKKRNPSHALQFLTLLHDKKCVQVKDRSITKGFGNFIRSKSRISFIFKKIAAMGSSYKGLVRAGVVAVVFVMSVCSIIA